MAFQSFRLFLLAASLCGCAGMVAKVKASVCSEAGGYQAGMNDGRDRQKMNLSQFDVLCEARQAPLAQKGYKEGYDLGLKSRSEEPATPIQINIGGSPARRSSGFICTLDTVNSHYSEWAANDSDAREAVLRRCREKQSGYHCDSTRVACVPVP